MGGRRSAGRAFCLLPLLLLLLLPPRKNSPERAVPARVHAPVGDIERREEHDAVPIDPVLDRERRVEDGFHGLGVARVDVEQERRLVEGEPANKLGGPRLGQLRRGPSSSRRSLGRSRRGLQEGALLGGLEDGCHRGRVPGPGPGRLEGPSDGGVVDDFVRVAVDVAFLRLHGPLRAPRERQGGEERSRRRPGRRRSEEAGRRRLGSSR